MPRFVFNDNKLLWDASSFVSRLLLMHVNVSIVALTQLIISIANYQYNYIYFQKGLGCHTMAIISMKINYMSRFTYIMLYIISDKGCRTATLFSKKYSSRYSVCLL